MDDLWQDLRHAWRAMRHSPGVVAAAIVSLALGIGANTAIFSLIDRLMLRALPVARPEQLVEILSRFPGEPRTNGFAWKYYELFRDQNRVFTSISGVSAPFRFQIGDDRAATESVEGEFVVADLFTLLGVRPAVGRLIDRRDDRIGSADAAVVVLSWAYWKSRFDLDPAIVGKRIVINGVPATIIGVTAPDYFGLQVGAKPSLWVPASMEPLLRQPSQRLDRSMPLALIARLKPGMSLEQARADIAVRDRVRLDDLATLRNAPVLRQFRIEIAPAAAGFSRLRDRLAPPLLVLMATVAVLLLLACVNIASVLLARGASRHREMAVRVSLGASRIRLLRQLLTESLLLAAAGAALGIVLAGFATRALVRILLSAREVVLALRNVELAVPMDTRVLLCTALAASATGIAFGLAPAWNAWMPNPAASLRGIGAVADTRVRRLFGKGLVTAQVALSVTLLSAAALLVGHLSDLRNVGLGFERDSVLLVTLNASRSGYERIQLSHLYRDLLQRLETIPGVRSASLSGVTPIQGPGAARMVTVEGFTEPRESRFYLSLNWVSPKFFATFGTPLLAGRDFTYDDEGRAPVAIVNQAMAHYYFGDGNALGRHFTFDGIDRTYEIVGIVADAKYRDLTEAAPRTIYLNTFQESRGVSNELAVRTDISPATLVDAVRRAMNDVVGTLEIARVTTLNEQVNASIVPQRMMAMLSAFFAAVAAILAATGLYGLLAYTVARRRTEIGVRMALGATRGDITAMIVKDAFVLVGLGLVAGAPLAIATRRLAVGMLDNLTVGSAVPLVVAVMAMTVAALAAAYVPARRAASIQPVEALRD